MVQRTPPSLLYQSRPSRIATNDATVNDANILPGGLNFINMQPSDANDVQSVFQRIIGGLSENMQGQQNNTVIFLSY